MAANFQLKEGLTLDDVIDFSNDRALEYYNAHYSQYGEITGPNIRRKVYNTLRDLSTGHVELIPSPPRVLQAPVVPEPDQPIVDEDVFGDGDNVFVDIIDNDCYLCHQSFNSGTPHVCPAQPMDTDNQQQGHSRSSRARKRTVTPNSFSDNQDGDDPNDPPYGPGQDKVQKRASSSSSVKSTGKGKKNTNKKGTSKKKKRSRKPTPFVKKTSQRKTTKATKSPVGSTKSKKKPVASDDSSSNDDDGEDDGDRVAGAARERRKYNKTVSEIQYAKYHGALTFEIEKTLASLKFSKDKEVPQPPSPELSLEEKEKEVKEKLEWSKHAYLSMQAGLYCKHDDCAVGPGETPKNYPYKYQLLLHYLIEHVDWDSNCGEYACPLENCGIMNHPHNVIDHLCSGIPGHINLRRYMCQLCSVAYHKMESLIGHMDYHKDETYHSNYYEKDADGKKTKEILHKERDCIHTEEDLILGFKNLLNPLIVNELSVSTFMNSYQDTFWEKYVLIGRGTYINYLMSCAIFNCNERRAAGIIFCFRCQGIPQALRQQCLDANRTPTLIVEDRVYFIRQVENRLQQRVNICGNVLCALPFGSHANYKSFCSKFCLENHNTNPPPPIADTLSRQDITGLYPWNADYENTPNTQLQTRFAILTTAPINGPSPMRHCLHVFGDDCWKMMCIVGTCTTNSRDNKGICIKCNKPATAGTALKRKPAGEHNFQVNVTEVNGILNYSVGDRVWIRRVLVGGKWERLCGHWGCGIQLTKYQSLFCRGHSFLFQDHLPVFLTYSHKQAKKSLAKPKTVTEEAEPESDNATT